MEQIMTGWIKLHRQLQDNPLWTCESFTRGQAWVDLLLLANHSESFFYKRDIKISVKRGQVGRSEVELADRWKWSRSKVRKFLKDLEKEQQIIQSKTNVTQLLTIKNYDEYQKKEQQDVQQKNTSRTPVEHQKNIYKNDKKENNDKNEKNNTHKKEFETFWNLYPKKVNKGRAETTFLRVRKKTSLEDLLNGLKTSPQMHREKQYIPNAQAWLNGQGWEDEADNTKLPFPQPHLKKYRLGDEDVYVDIEACMVYTAQGDEHSIYEYNNGMITS